MATEKEIVHVLAAAIIDDRGRVLLARRHDHLHQGGLWEFPGGKRQPGERPVDALLREVHEELDISLTRYRPLIQVAHDYPDKSVLLDVWLADRWRGEPRGVEGQPIEWAAITGLAGREFPAANLPVVRALQLPVQYLITPEPGSDHQAFLGGLERSLAAGIRLLQLRARNSPAAELGPLASQVVERCHAHGARLLLNGTSAAATDSGADGVHLCGSALRGCSVRPLPPEHLVAASCHGAEDIAHACRIGVDFLVLSPVKKTASHPQASPLGWPRFAELAQSASVPVFALGGMRDADLDDAWCHGGQGIAGIRGLWSAA